MPNMQAQLAIYMPNKGAGTGEERFLTFRLPGKWYILDVQIVADEAVAADNTDYSTYALKKGVGGSTICSSDSRAANLNGLAKGVAKALGTITEGAVRVLEQGDVLEFSKADSGAGKAFEGTVMVVVEHRPLP